MLALIRQHPRAFIAALVIHLIMIALMAIGVDWETQPAAAPVKIVQATMVDVSKIREAEEQKQREEAAQRKKIEDDQKRKADEQRRKEDEQRRLEEQKHKEAEAKRQAELKKKQEADLKKKQEAEQQRKLEAEKKRKEEADRKRKEDAERKRKEEAERKRQEELAKLRAEEDRIRQEQMAAEQAQLQAAREREANREMDRYLGLIQQRVASKWVRPSGWRAGLECKILVRLVPGAAGGQVIDVRLTKSCGQPLFDRSVETAVFNASPLPLPKDQALASRFRELEFIFRPED